MLPKTADLIPAPRLQTLLPMEQNQAFDWMWEVAVAGNENQSWVALDAIVRIWGDRDAQILLDGYVDEGKFWSPNVS